MSFTFRDIKKNSFQNRTKKMIFLLPYSGTERRIESNSSRSRASYAVIKNHDGVTFYITMKHCALNIVAVFALAVHTHTHCI